MRSAVGRQLGGHVADVVGIAFLALGSLAALALATDLAGPIGAAVADGITFLLGRGAFLVPVAFLVTAVLVLAGRPAADEADADESGGAAPLRIGIGLALVLIGVTGLFHVTGDAPELDAPAVALRGSGGIVGVLLGGRMASGLGAVGAGIVLVSAIVLGALLTPGVPLHRVLAAIGRSTRATTRYVRRRFSELSTIDDSTADDSTADDSAETGSTSGATMAETASPRATTRRATAELYDELDEGGAVSGTEPMDEPEPAADAELDLVEAAIDGPGSGGDVAADLDADTDTDTDTGAGAGAGTPHAAEVAVLAGDDPQLAIDLGPRHRPPVWKLPPKTILKRGSGGKLDQRVLKAGGQVLEATMREFGVEAHLIGMTVGPTVTRYELELAAGVKVSRVTGLAKEIAYSMASHDVRILAPIPGRSAIGVEVPNKQRPLVTLGDVLASEEARQAKNPLEVALGRDIAGKDVLLPIAQMPHVLIAGTTGAGKSSCINSIVTSLLMRSTPEEVRLILIDPKRVELGRYDGLPHLLTSVVTNPKKAANALDWAVREMEMRYEMLADIGTRDIDGYNAMYDRGELPTEETPDPHGGTTYRRLPYILVVVDELSDLMMVAARDVETSVCRLAQMARAVGIHLVIATQRPSVDVITGLIKANVPSRLAFKVRSVTDSRVILDQAGAEKLVGEGDMLMITLSSSLGQRIQGAWVDEECVRKVVAHWRRQARGEPGYVDGVVEETAAAAGGAVDLQDDDELFDQAMELVVAGGLGSTSMLQRKLRVGFARAGRLMDLLERKGIVGPSEGSKARAVLMTAAELEELRAKA